MTALRSQIIEAPYWFREFDKETRDKLAKSGAAMPDGSYPIENEEDLHNAMKAVGRSDPSKRGAVRAHIRSRAKALGLESALSDTVKSSSEPDVSDVHVNAPVNSEKPTRHFLQRMRDLLKGKVHPEEFDEAVRQARGYAGGKTSADNRKNQVSIGYTGTETGGQIFFDFQPDPAEVADVPEEVEEAIEQQHPGLEKSDKRVNYRDATKIGTSCSACKFFEANFENNDEHECVLVEGFIRDNGLCDLFISAADPAQQMAEPAFIFGEPIYFMEPPERLPYMPVPGVYQHKEYGKVVITRQKNQRMVDNFKAAVYQEELPIDAEHQTKLSGACAYVTDMWMNEDGSVDAKPRWTDRGTTFLKADRFTSFSPQYFETWVDPATGQEYRDVAIGGALTTRPFFKSKSLRPLAASENLLVGWFAPREERSMADDKTKEDEKEDAKDKGDDEADEGEAMTEQKIPQGFTEQLAALQRENAALKTMSEKQDAQAKQMAEIVAGMAKDSRTKQFTDEVLGRSDSSGARWYGDVEEHVSFMETLHENGLEEQLQKYIEQNRTHAEQLVQAGLFSERGRAGTAGASASDKLDGMIKAKVAEGKTLAEATDLVMSENPQLYAEYSEAKSFRDGDN